MLTTAAVPDVLDAAADHIERVGLARGRFYAAVDWPDFWPSDLFARGGKPDESRQAKVLDSPCCALGALGVAAPTGRMYTRAVVALDVGLRPVGVTSISSWSDTAGQAAVVATLRCIAADLRAAS